jgi:lysophospholipase L1-like esterase
MEQAVFSRRFAKRLACLIAGTVLFAGVLCVILTHAATGNEAPAWSVPNAMAIRRTSQLTGAQSEPVFLNNLDCMPLTYRLVATGTMQTGCFTETAFGLLDSDSGTAIFNGTDEGLPILPYSSQQVLVPWPKALNLVGLSPISTGGTFIGLYKNPLAALQDQRNFLGQLTAKQLSSAADIILKDPLGKPLVINPQTIAFSDGGAWLVAETLGGSFVRINLATLSITAFAQAYGSQGSPALLKSRVAITDNGRFIAIANDVATAFKVYDLATCNGVVNNLQPQNCHSYDYWSFAQQQISGLQSIRHLRFVNDGLLSFDAIASDTAKSGTYELAPAASIDSLTDYIGLGDSYTSGEGAFDYLDGTDTPDNMCHTSRNSYPLLLTHDLFSGAGGHSVACSGAVIKDVGSTDGNYRGQVRNVPSLQQLQEFQALLLESVETNFIPGYIAQQRFVKRWQPRIATVSIGGNDIGFGSILQNCIMPHISRHMSDNTCYNTYEDRLELSRLVDRTVPRWTALYNQLKREAPGMRLYAIGYPQLADSAGSCGLNVQLDTSELEFAAGMVDYLNQSIQKAAVAAHIPYVDISQALAGHRLCETASHNVAVNGLTAGTDAGIVGIKVIGKESYHPNALGHVLIEQAILRQTRNFAETSSDTMLSNNPGSSFLNAPVSGRPINILVPDNTLTDGVGKRGASIPIQANGATDGLRSSTFYAVHLDGPAGPVLGTIMTDAAGNLQGSVTIPTNTVPGGHTIDITGGNQSGKPVDVTQPVYVSASDADRDGDGIENITDTCPGAINSGQDADRDGVDDVCDNLIGLPPAAASSGSSSNQLGSHLILGTETIVAHLSASPAQLTSSTSAGHVLGTAALTGHNSVTLPDKSSLPHRTGTRMVPRKTHGYPWLVLIIVSASFILVTYIFKRLNFNYNRDTMNRARKVFVYLLSFFLLATLLGTAVSTSTNNTLGKPKKVEAYLAQSKLYDHFIAYTADQAKKTNGDTDQSGSVSLSDAAVQAAAQSSFTPQVIEKNVNTFIDSNYAWLEGKTATPEFKIDLSEQKLTFAQKVGQYVTTYTAGLPACANDQLAAQQSQDPLAATCRPANVTPEAAGAQVTQRLSTTGDFLSNPVVTPNSINPEASQQSKPYYQKLSHLPKAYQLSQKLPYIFAGLSLLAALGIIFISLERRKGVRKVGIVLLIAGISLVAVKFTADMAFRRAEDRVFNTASVGQLQQSLTDFAHRIEASVVRIDLWFGIGFLLLAAIIFIVLTATRNKDGKGASPDTPAKEEAEPDDDKAPLVLSRKRLLKPAVKDLTPRARPAEDAPTPSPQPKKPTRLIQ